MPHGHRSCLSYHLYSWEACTRHVASQWTFKFACPNLDEIQVSSVALPVPVASASARKEIMSTWDCYSISFIKPPIWCMRTTVQYIISTWTSLMLSLLMRSLELSTSMGIGQYSPIIFLLHPHHKMNKRNPDSSQFCTLKPFP